MEDRSFCGNAVKSKRGSQLLVVVRADELSANGVDCLFSEAVRMGHAGGQVQWFRSDRIAALPRYFSGDARRTLPALRRIAFRYCGSQLTEKLAAFCAEMHLRKCPDLLVVELTASDVPTDSVRAALLAMLADAANWIAERRKNFSTVFPVMVAVNECEQQHFDQLFTDCCCSLSLLADRLVIRSTSATNVFRWNDREYVKEVAIK